EVLYRELYRGRVVWNQTRKRDKWGHKHQHARGPEEWITREAKELRIVSDEAWQAAHARLQAARTIYLGQPRANTAGRPRLGNPSKYLMTNLALCGRCGGPLKARSRAHGKGRRLYYGCAWYHERGRTVCANVADVPMEDANLVLIEALLDDVLDESMLNDAI